MSMHQSFDVRLSVEKREQAVSELLNINDIRKQAVQDEKIINFCSECIIDMTRDTTIADRNSLVEDVREELVLDLLREQLQDASLAAFDGDLWSEEGTEQETQDSGLLFNFGNGNLTQQTLPQTPNAARVRGSEINQDKQQTPSSQQLVREFMDCSNTNTT